MAFKKGQAVIRELHGGGMVSQEEEVVLRVDKDGVWLDNGPGNDPDGPFDSKTGWHSESVFGFRQRIAAKATD